MTDLKLDPPLDVPQYFLDDTYIERHRHVHRRWMAAESVGDPIIVPDEPWEKAISFLSVLSLAPDEFRMYYGEFDGLRLDAEGHHNSKLLVATSRDGLVWTKPRLGLVPVAEGGADNNVVLASTKYFDSSNVVRGKDGVFRLLQFDHDRVIDQMADLSDFGLSGYESDDGYSWRPIAGTRVAALDRNTLLVTDSGEYLSYNRHLDMWADYGARAIFLSRSDDFVSWTEPALVMAPDLDDGPDIEFYGISVFERHGWFWGLLEVWQRDQDQFHIELVYSRDGTKWSRSQSRTPFIAPTQEWGSKWIAVATGEPIEIADHLVFYFNGRNIAHGWSPSTMHGVVGKATIGVDRFCAIEADAPGSFETPTFRWRANALRLNADTRSKPGSHPHRFDGRIAVEILDAAGDPLPEWSGTAAGVFVGNTYARGRRLESDVLFPGGALNQLAGQEVRLRFSLDRSRLFTFTLV